ncbi:arginyl tRNA synthetase [Chlamydia felis Fe/C-56]|uniref:Arginine--tRNA ligase n=1 Tax=Chlamydia felis (strain Fe/C-56) TaxID=264202 RepID=SYR_CHLFF|nr:arginine--tRNA ligase [Chlamydia felis]Q253D1.1 RecName: Full=Arginine--tRNA ligase; AltName: Full=Arginyl-tRNA synthetase; Short=ArgRS [Chlamydia felis Fe/C-56]BAE81607.1 arginyl tRNA synthetase [Chlamydia felis Fe/C-56]
MTLLSYLSSLCREATLSAFPQVENPSPDITQSTKEHFGHYQCNDAMKLDRTLKMAPRAIAEAIVNNLPKDNFSSVEVAGAGFINFTFSKEFLKQRLETFSADLSSGFCVKDPKKIVIDFSSPNIAKDMHVGHLRSTIIGDCLARVFSFVGNDVLRLNHIGDWGTAFGMLITYLQEEASEDVGNLEDLTALYKKAHARFAEDVEFKKRSQANVVALQSGDPSALNLWKHICEISERAFQKIYDILGVAIEKRGESFYNPFLPEIIQDLENKKLITVSDNAKCVFHEGFSIPLMVQKSDGGYNYATTDLAAMRYRVEKDHADKIIIVTDMGQSLHFQLLEATALAAGYLRDKETFSHVGFGLVLDSEGKKFKTRSGENIKLKELLNTAVDQAVATLKEHRPEMSEEEISQRAPILGINAIKYADLSSHRVSDYVFSFEKMLRFEGNTAMFLLYAYVRIQGIKRRLNIEKLNLEAVVNIQEPAEEALALALLRFPEAIDVTLKELCPHFLTDYLYMLTNKFNAFFRDCHIEGSPYQQERLYLCALVEKTLATGMHLLGLQTLDRL